MKTADQLDAIDRAIGQLIPSTVLRNLETSNGLMLAAGELMMLLADCSSCLV